MPSVQDTEKEKRVRNDKKVWSATIIQRWDVLGISNRK